MVTRFGPYLKPVLRKGDKERVRSGEARKKSEVKHTNKPEVVS